MSQDSGVVRFDIQLVQFCIVHIRNRNTRLFISLYNSTKYLGHGMRSPGGRTAPLHERIVGYVIHVRGGSRGRSDDLN